jgi:copper transport protein
MRVSAIVLCLIGFPAAAFGALLHAALLRSTPTANAHLTKAPETIRLVFSEPIVADLSHISLIGPDAKTVALRVATDPHDAHTLVGAVGSLASGQYKVSWHVLSADGHPVGGAFAFTLGTTSIAAVSSSTVPRENTASTTEPALTADTSSSTTTTATTEADSIPILASTLRGLGLGAMMAGVGLLFFGMTSGDARHRRPSPWTVRPVAAAVVLLIAHLLAWIQHISPDGILTGDFIGAALSSTPGMVEVSRVGLALLTLWAVALARRGSIALVFGVACLLVSGAIGHPAAIHPLWSIPFKAVHLLAGAAWLGGLLWLGAVGHDDASFPAEARRVSSVALICAIAILVSGALQTAMFLNAPSDLVRSAYGRLALIKIVGLLALIGLGAFNRFLLLPAVADSGTRPALTRTVRQEIAIVVVLILVGGFLAYVPTPPAPQSAATASTGMSR